MKKVNHILAILLTSVLVLGAAGTANSAAVLADLENAIMCKCDDKCGKVLINCTCDTAEKNRVEFVKMLDSGITVEQIIQMQMDKYGETVLSAPTKSGFNLTAWLTPFAAIFAGGFGIKRIIEAWTRKRRPGSLEKESLGKEVPDTLPSATSRRLQDELDKIEL